LGEQWYSLMPDALAEYRVGQQQMRFWLEWDRGTMNARDLAIKFTSYVSGQTHRHRWIGDVNQNFSPQLRLIGLKHIGHRLVANRQDHHLIADGAAKGNGLSARSLARYRLQIRSQCHSFFWIARKQRDRVPASNQPSADAESHVTCPNDRNVHRLPPCLIAVKVRLRHMKWGRRASSRL